MKTWLVALAFLGSAIDAGGMVAGGGRPATDCYAVFDGVTATRPRSTRVRCVDGDPTCDHDCVRGQCTFAPRVCVGALGVPGCTPPGDVTVARASRRLVTEPLSPDVIGRCAPASAIVVPARGPRHTRRLRLVARAGDARRDDDRLILRCLACRGAKCSAAARASSECPTNADGGPRQLTVRVGNEGSDLDIGTTGASHNFPVPEGTSLTFCLSGCNGTATTRCDGHGTTGPGSLNGRTFGPPLPLFASGVPVCVVNRFHDTDIRSTVDVTTGVVDMTQQPLRLDADVFLTGPTQLCPRCVTAGTPALGARGTCEDGGAPCSIEGIVTVNNPPTVRNTVYGLSSSCLPATGLQATIGISLPLTSGTAELRAPGGGLPCPGQTRHDDCGVRGGSCASACTGRDLKGGVNQWCCSDDGRTPCFPTASGTSGTITREGVSVVPTPPFPDSTYPKTGADAVLAATFCIARTGSPVVDVSAGLPGPGALLLRGTHTLLEPQAQTCGP